MVEIATRMMIQYTGAAELVDGLDNDCDTALSTDEIDLDGDGYILWCS